MSLSSHDSSAPESAMSIVDHLAELRKRLIRTMLVLIAGMVVGLAFAQPIITYIKSVPPANHVAWHVFSPWDAFKLYMNVAFLTGLMVTLPVAMYQLWAFLKPGLRKEEQRASLMFVPFAFILFVIGLAFAYFVVFRMAFGFTSELSRMLELQETFGIAQYFSFMFNILIPVACIFELPIVIMFLTRLRVLNPVRMNKLRRYAYLTMVIIASIITPPDLLSAVVVSIPMILLYEISVWLSGIVYRKQQEQDRLWEQEYGLK